LLVDDDFMYWQQARVVPRREAFGASLVTVELEQMCRPGKLTLSARDKVLADALEKRGSPELARLMRGERARRFFWGLGSEHTWDLALPAAEAMLDAVGVRQGWEEWKMKTLRQYARTDVRLRRLMRIEKARSVRSSPYHFRNVKGT
jgi:hypothetical protein